MHTYGVKLQNDCGMWRGEPLVGTDVSEKCIASIIRVETNRKLAIEELRLLGCYAVWIL
jgi:hypothetical protein